MAIPAGEVGVAKGSMVGVGGAPEVEVGAAITVTSAGAKPTSEDRGADVNPMAMAVMSISNPVTVSAPSITHLLRSWRGPFDSLKITKHFSTSPYHVGASTF